MIFPCVPDNEHFPPVVIPARYYRGETIRIGASHPDRDHAIQQIEIRGPEGIILEKSEMVVIVKGSGEHGDTTFSKYDYTIDDNAALGKYKYTVTVCDKTEIGEFEVVE